MTRAPEVADLSGPAGPFATILRELGEGLDYQGHASPEALAARASVTVVGVVESVDEGRAFGPGPTRDVEPVFLNATLRVRVERVLGGDASAVRDGKLFVELARTKVVSTESLRQKHQPQQRLVLFLDDYTSGPGFRLLDRGASIPAGARVFAPYADGLLVEDGDAGRVIGGFVSLDSYPAAWREGTENLAAFLATHFPAAA